MQLCDLSFTILDPVIAVRFSDSIGNLRRFVLVITIGGDGNERGIFNRCELYSLPEHDYRLACFKRYAIEIFFAPCGVQVQFVNHLI